MTFVVILLCSLVALTMAGGVWVFFRERQEAAPQWWTCEVCGARRPWQETEVHQVCAVDGASWREITVRSCRDTGSCVIGARLIADQKAQEWHQAHGDEKPDYRQVAIDRLRSLGTETGTRLANDMEQTRRRREGPER